MYRYITSVSVTVGSPEELSRQLSYNLRNLVKLLKLLAILCIYRLL